ncbi:hypothetical protein SAMN05216540_1177 [Butyrivibrio sp. M55]|nr:hypothetical protein SAMN05216540_1177 [Butyrivibrio sp. M55]
MPYLKNMNVLIELTKKAIGKALIKDALNDVEYDFKWNDPADLNEIEDFEKETGCKIQTNLMMPDMRYPSDAMFL